MIRPRLSSKTVAFAALIALIALMAAATFVEHYRGTPTALNCFYHAPWFIALWVLTLTAGWAKVFKARLPRPSLLLHLALGFILIGAGVSFFTSESGQMHLRTGETADYYSAAEHQGDSVQLPFQVSLKQFDVAFHAGTESPAQFTALLEIAQNGDETVQKAVAMNHVCDYGGVRFFLTSYDSDHGGVLLSVRSDAWGTGISYAGYALLFFAFAWLLVCKKGGFRRILSSRVWREGKTTLCCGLMLLLSIPAQATPTTVSRETAQKFGTLLVNYEGRICPMQTLARDFTAKLYGDVCYDGLTAEQVVLGWTFWPEEWNQEPLIKVKGQSLRKEYGLNKNAAFTDFFMGGYRLGPLVAVYYNQGDRSALAKEAVEIDDKLQLIYSLRHGRLFKIFPVSLREGAHTKTNISWVCPTDTLNDFKLTPHDSAFISAFFGELYQAATTGQEAFMLKKLDEMAIFQQSHGGATLPPDHVVKAERLYNAFNLPVWLSRLHLCLGLLLCLALLKTTRRFPGFRQVAYIVMAISWLALSGYTVLRSIVSGHLPVGNGYETTLSIAWCAMLLTLLLGLPCRKGTLSRRLLLPFGFLVSGFFLLVASMGLMNPQITPLIPVLASPWLSVHVSLVMLAYMCLTFTCLCSLMAFCSLMFGRISETELMRLSQLARLFLYPALACLAAGIFTGAVWAGESWGRYWGWDPKETWALITLLVYALPLHEASMPAFRRPRFFLAYLLLAFTTVLMTYIGVNYYLTGLHSYAG